MAVATALTGAATAQPADAGPPSPAEAMRAWQEVDRWVRSWTIPPDAADFPAAAACVTLRLNGEVVGRGEDYRADDRSVWRAALQAMEEASVNAAAEQGIPNDALRNDRLRMLAGRLTLGIELAGSLTPFAPATYKEARATLAPGAEGVCARLGDELRGMFPATMLSTNMLPHEALANRAAAVVGNAAAGLEEPGQLAERHGVVFYRFETIHLAQTGRGQTPTFLRRGARLVLLEQLTGAELERMGRAMSSHLAARISRGEGGGVIGEGYQPWLDRFEGQAGGEALLLAGLALQRWQEGSGATEEAHTQAMAIVREAALALPTGVPVEEGKALPLAFGVALVAREFQRGGPGEARVGPSGEDARAWLGNAAVALASLHDGETGFASQVGPHEQAPLAWALAEAAVALGEEGAALQRAADGVVRRLYRETAEGRLVQHMPWLGWAEVALAGEGEPIAAAASLRRMREHVWEHQVGRLDVENDEADVVGGIVFTASDTPLPDWHTFRPVAFLATMLGDPRMTDGPERSLELARLLSSLRFLRQLEADESHLWMFRNAGLATGGVRAALWDQRMPADATSLGLLTVAEARRSLVAISERR